MIPAGKNFSATPFTFREKIAQMRSLLTQPTFISMYMIAALSMGIFVSVYNYLSFLLESPLFALPHHLVAMIFMMYIAGIIGSVVAGSLSDKFAPEILLQGTLLLMGIGMSCLLVMKLWIIVLGLGILTFLFRNSYIGKSDCFYTCTKFKKQCNLYLLVVLLPRFKSYRFADRNCICK